MAKRRNPLSHIRLVYRRSSPLLKCVVLAAIVLSTAALLILGISIRQTRSETESLRAEAAQLEEENRQLQENITQLGTMQSIKRIAVEELGLVDPDTEFFIPEESNP